MSLAACQDYDGGFNSSDLKKAEYAKNFEKVFGKVDPNQDWSTATKVTANIDLSNAPKGSYLVKIFDKNPMGGGVLIRQEIVTDAASLSFDVLKGADKVFIRATRTDVAGLYAFNGYFKIVDGVVNTNLESTRTSTADNCDTKKGDAINVTGTIVKPDWVFVPGKDNGIEVSDYKTVNHRTLASLAQQDNEKKVYYCFNSDETAFMVYNRDGSYKETTSDLKIPTVPDGYDAVFFWYDETKGWTEYPDIWHPEPYCVPYSYKPKHYELQNVNKTCADLYPGGFYKLSDVFTEPGTKETCLFDEILPIVSPLYSDTYFTEGLDNRALYPDKLIPNVEYELMANGPITFTHIYGGTDYNNQLGYFYWFESPGMTADQKKAARDAAPRYVFMENTDPQHNITCEGAATDGKRFPTWVGQQDLMENHLGHTLLGTKYHLAYFGENYTATTGDYEFKAKNSSGATCHVAFFMFAAHHSSDASNLVNGLRYSIQDMNFDTNHLWSSTSSSGYNETKGDVYAVTYSYKGTVVVGFEDDVDMDQNDILYFVSAPIVPPTEVTTETEEAQQSWVVACEDLGGTFDYDFNDLVFALTEVDSRYETTIDGQISSTGIDKSELFLAPLAAGGTLPAYIYYDGKLVGEIHDLLKKGASTGTPINVGTGVSVSLNKNLRVKLCDLDKEKAIDQTGHESYIAEQLAKISIKVENTKEAETILQYKFGDTNEAPQMLLLPMGWDWPAESMTIDEYVYPEFKEWVESSQLHTDWYLHKKDGAVAGKDYINNPYKTYTFE